MKISSTRSFPRGRKLDSVRKGSAIVFCKQFHQDHKVEDPFIVVNDNGYLYESRCRRNMGQIVVNLRTGKMSIVQGCRECRVLDSEVVINDYDNRY